MPPMTSTAREKEIGTPRRSMATITRNGRRAMWLALPEEAGSSLSHLTEVEQHHHRREEQPDGDNEVPGPLRELHGDEHRPGHHHVVGLLESGQDEGGAVERGDELDEVVHRAPRRPAE